MLPRPTAEPMAAKMNATGDFQWSRPPISVFAAKQQWSGGNGNVEDH
jgi:maltoporin